MISVFGNFSLWLMTFFALLQLQLINFGKKNNQSVLKFNNIAVNGLLLCSLISFFSLTYSYVISDFSLVNVYENSHTTKPLIYKISGVWGNHEGSMLLWIFVLTIFNYLIFKLYNEKNFEFISKTLQTQAFIIFGFILFTILTSNPFEELIPVPKEGMGLNPILQDPILAIHPPTLYLGYVGFSLVFSLAIAS